MRTPAYTTATLAIAAALLAGCAVPDAPQPPNPLPAEWLAPLPEAAAVQEADAQWWKSYGDERLNALVERALAANPDILVAILNIENADAVLRETGAALIPQVDDAGSGVRSGTGSGPGSNAFSLAARLDYELDFWGRVRATRQAALESLRATEYAASVTRQTLVESVVTSYVSALSAAAQLKFQQESLGVRNELVRIAAAKQARGTGTQLEVEQARANAASLAATVESLRLELAQWQTTIGILVADPQYRLPELPADLLPVPPAVKPGLPSELLAQRPDIRQIEASLAQKHALVHVARTRFLPSISLTGSFGGASAQLGNLFDRPVWSAGLALDMPIFDAGTRMAQLDEAKIAVRIDLERYRKAALTAFGEVRNALEAVSRDKTIEQARAQELSAAQRADRIARAAYEAGSKSFTDVLTTQVALHSAQVFWVKARAARLVDIASLNIALGQGAQVPAAPAPQDARPQAQ